MKDVLKHATPTRDFSNLVLRIKSLKPDLVIISDYQNEYVLLARTLYSRRPKSPASSRCWAAGSTTAWSRNSPKSPST